VDKDYASLRLGGEDAAARWLGISPDIYREWPPILHPVMVDRVYAAVLRKEMAKTLGVSPRQFFNDLRNEVLLESMIERIAIASIAANLMRNVPGYYARTPSGYGTLSAEPDPTTKRTRRRRHNSEEDLTENMQ
jgi:hypothetical protein